MSDAIGILSMNDLRRWEIVQGACPELSSGSRVLIEVDAVLRLTRIEYAHDAGGQYYSVDNYQLAGGLRAAPPGDAEDGQKLA